MKKKMKYYIVTIKEEKETPVCVKANTEQRAVNMANLLYWQRSTDRRILHGNADITSCVTKVEEEKYD